MKNKFITLIVTICTSISGCATSLASDVTPAVDVTPSVVTEATIEPEAETLEAVEVVTEEAKEVETESAEVVEEAPVLNYDAAGEYVVTLDRLSVKNEADANSETNAFLPKKSIVNVEYTVNGYAKIAEGFVKESFLEARSDYEAENGIVYTATMLDEVKVLYCKEYSNFRVEPDGEVSYSKSTNETVTVVGVCNENDAWYLVEDGAWTLVSNLVAEKVVVSTPQVTYAAPATSDDAPASQPSDGENTNDSNTSTNPDSSTDSDNQYSDELLAYFAECPTAKETYDYMHDPANAWIFGNLGESKIIGYIGMD